MKEKAIILLSGGIDSVTMAAVSHEEYDLHGLIFDYGQMHDKEIEYAKRAAIKYCSSFEVMNIEVPHGTGGILLRRGLRFKPSREISNFWVPGRNLLFLSYAAIVAMAHKTKIILIGANETDREGFPDCRGSFLSTMEAAINEAMGYPRDHILIFAPLILSGKVNIISIAVRHGVDIVNDTWSCYQGGDIPCGECGACITRNEALKEAYNAGIIGEDQVIRK